MTQQHASVVTSGWHTLTKILVATAVAAVPLGLPPATASTVTAPTDHPSVTATQTNPDRAAPCRRWQNPNAYGHWHCR